MRKAITLTTLFVFVFIALATGQKARNSAQITFEMFSIGSDTAGLGRSFIVHAFEQDRQAVDLDLMNGLLKSRILSYNNAPEKSKMFIDIYGIKYEIVELSEEYIKNGITVGNLSNTVEVRYDKKDTKQILGYACYKAYLTLNTGEVNQCYITEKIAYPNNIESTGVSLNGYPLEIRMFETEGSETVLQAVEIEKKPSEEIFNDLEGYERMTYEEFNQMME